MDNKFFIFIFLIIYLLFSAYFWSNTYLRVLLPLILILIIMVIGGFKVSDSDVNDLFGFAGLYALFMYISFWIHRDFFNKNSSFKNK